jgi:hypothetical protein
MKARSVIATCLVAGVVPVLSAGAADAAPKLVKYKNCTALNKSYKHGPACARPRRPEET